MLKNNFKAIKPTENISPGKKYTVFNMLLNPSGNIKLRYLVNLRNRTIEKTPITTNNARLKKTLSRLSNRLSLLKILISCW